MYIYMTFSLLFKATFDTVRAYLIFAKDMKIVKKISEVIKILEMFL